MSIHCCVLFEFRAFAVRIGPVGTFSYAEAQPLVNLRYQVLTEIEIRKTGVIKNLAYLMQSLNPASRKHTYISLTPLNPTSV